MIEGETAKKMSNLVMPSFEEMRFVCNNCGNRFSGRDTEDEKKQSKVEYALLERLQNHHPKCLNCGSRKTDKDMMVFY